MIVFNLFFKICKSQHQTKIERKRKKIDTIFVSSILRIIIINFKELGIKDVFESVNILNNRC